MSLDAPSGDEHARLAEMVPDESSDPTVVGVDKNDAKLPVALSATLPR